MRGWKYEGYRHSLAARGIKTSFKGFSEQQAELARKSELNMLLYGNQYPQQKAREFLDVVEVKEKLYNVAKQREIDFLKTLTPEQRVSYLEQQKKGIVTKQQYFNEGTWSPERQQLHSNIFSDYSGEIPKSEEPQVIMSSGLPASGKSRVLSEMFTKVDENVVQDRFGRQYVVIDVDKIKSKLPEYGERGLTAAMVHDEGSWLKEELFDKLTGKKANIILDTTMRRYDATKKLLNQLKQAGYTTGLVYVEISPDVAMERAEKRFLDPTQGRMVPHEVIVESAVVVPNVVKSIEPEFDRYIKYSNMEGPEVIQKRGDWVKKILRGF